MVQFRIDIVVDHRGAGRGITIIEKRLRVLQDRARGLESMLRRAFAGFIAARAVRDLIGLADTFTLVQNKLSQVTSSTAELQVVTEELFAVSQRTRSSFEETAKLYQRTALATRDLGISQRETIKFTEGLNQAIILSGASTSEAKNGLIQLSQGLALGTVQGRDLKSVMEQIPVVSDIIAKSLGIGRGQLREYGSQGKITAEVVINAFKEAEVSLRQNFLRTVSTVGQGFTLLRNSFVAFIGQIDKASGFTRGLAQGLVFLSQNFEEFARVVGFAATTLGVTFAVVAVQRALIGLATLGTAILTNPVLLLATLMGASIAALVNFGDRIQWSTEGLANLQDVAKAAFDIFTQIGVPAITELKNLFAGLIGLTNEVDFKDIALRFADSIDLMMNLTRGLVAGVLELFDTDFTFGATMEILFKGSLKQVEILFQQTADFVTSVFNDPIKAIASAIQALLGAAIGAGRVLGSIGVGQGTVDKLENFLSKVEANSALLQNNGPSDKLKELNSELEAVIKEGASILANSSQETFSQIGDRAGKAFRDSFDGALARNDARTLVEEVSKQAEEGARNRRDKTRREDEAREAAREALGNKGEKTSRAGKKGLNAAQKGLQRRVSPDQAAAESRLRLEELRSLNAITEDEFTKAMDNVQLKSLQASTTMADGFRESFLRIKMDAEDFSKVAGGIFDSVINRTTDSLVELATTGSTSFKDLANSIARDALKIITKLLVIQALNAAIGGVSGIVGNIAGSAAASGVDGARANGGPVQPGRSFLVGEDGPEIFQPKRAGTIIPNGESGQQAPIVVTPTIVNVRSESEIPDAIGSGAADDVILNVFERNPERARRALGR